MNGDAPGAVPPWPRPFRRSEKIYQTLARDIAYRIREQELLPGSSLPPESQLLGEYQVGRASLREALRVLELNGLITIKPGPGGGPVVAEVNAESFGRTASFYFQARRMTFRELIEARLVMEPVMARLAAERKDPALLDHLRATVAQGQSADLTNDTEYMATSADFHLAIAAMSSNGMLSLFGGALLEIFHARVSQMLLPLPRRRSNRAAHANIARAIENSEPDKAENLMREYMLDYFDYAKRHHPALLTEIVDWS